MKGSKMTFKEYIRLSDELYAQAFKRHEIFREAENKRAQIYYHLLKVLFYKINCFFNIKVTHLACLHYAC